MATMTRAAATRIVAEHLTELYRTTGLNVQITSKRKDQLARLVARVFEDAQFRAHEEAQQAQYASGGRTLYGSMTMTEVAEVLKDEIADHTPQCEARSQSQGVEFRCAMKRGHVGYHDWAVAVDDERKETVKRCEAPKQRVYENICTARREPFVVRAWFGRTILGPSEEISQGSLDYALSDEVAKHSGPGELSPLGLAERLCSRLQHSNVVNAIEVRIYGQPGVLIYPEWP